jgi:branched-chain amino acid transport system substrate-binding protein
MVFLKRIIKFFATFKPYCKHASFLFVFMGIATAFFACAEPEPLKIGFVGSLTGKRSDIGVSARNAVQLYIDEVNKAGGINGRKIKIIIKDNEGDTETSELILSEFISDGIQFIIGPLFSQMAETTIKTSKDKNIFIMSPSMSTPILSGIDDNIFRIVYSTNVQSKLLSNYFIAKEHKRIGVVYDLRNKQYTEVLYTEFKKQMENKNIPINLLERINDSKTSNFSEIAKKIHTADIDYLLLILSATDAASIAQQLKKIESKTNLYGVSWTQTNDLIKYGGKAVEGMHLVSILRNKEKTKAHVDFDQKFIQKYSTDPSFICVLAYDAIDVLIKGMKNADSLTPDAVKKSILAIKTFQGLDSSIVFDEFGDVAGQCSLVIIKNGSFIPVKFP